MKSQDLNHQADPPDGSYSPEAQTETATLEQLLPKTIVLVYAAWLGKWQWNAVVPYLEKEGFRVQAPDLPGHGEDMTPPGIITMEDLAEQMVDDLIDIEDLTEERAAQLIMTAREPWFAE